MRQGTITFKQLKTLRAEAAEHGDSMQVALCDEALAGDEPAIEACERVIRLAQAEAEANK